MSTKEIARAMLQIAQEGIQGGPMRGVILAGGRGTRLGDLTKVTNKHLLPVGEMPMIYYPLKKLIGAGIKDILLVTGPEHMGAFVDLLGSGREHGCSLTYRVQDEAGGIAQALGLAESFVDSGRVCVVLGDNVFHDPIPGYILPDSDGYPEINMRAWVVLKSVEDPGRYGVAYRDQYTRRITRIDEKPGNPDSDLAVTGIYIYPPDVFSVIRGLKPSARGELEITDVNNHYIKEDRLEYCILPNWWTDAGTFESLNYANQMVREKPPLW